MRPQVIENERSLPKLTSAAVQYGLQQIGADVKIGPEEAVMRCCFHNSQSDKPHLYINVSSKPGVWHCFACGAAGTFSEVVAKYTGWSMLKTLLEINTWLRDTSVIDFAVAVLPKRQIVDTDADRLAPYRWRHQYVYDRGVSESTALLYQLGFDRQQMAVTIPWFTYFGALVGFKRRTVAFKSYLFDLGVDFKVTLFGLDHVAQHSTVWIVEGEFDAMRIYQSLRAAHFDNHCVVALGGKYIHDSQISALLRTEPVRLVLLLDNDDAGKEAQTKVRSRLISRIKVVEPVYPAGVHDPAALTLEDTITIAKLTERENVSARIQSSRKVSL